MGKMRAQEVHELKMGLHRPGPAEEQGILTRQQNIRCHEEDNRELGWQSPLS